MNLLTNPSKLLVRNSEQLEAEHILVVQPKNDRFVAQLRQLTAASVNVYTTSEATRSQLADEALSGISLSFGDIIPVTGDAPDIVILYLQKSRDYMNFLLAMILPLLADNGQLLLVGENDCGIKSWQERLAGLGEVSRLDSARHCSLFSLKPQNNPSSFVSDEWKGIFEEEIHDTRIKAVTYPGVFSHGRLDRGTRLLLETMNAGFRNDILDFGCGSGVVGAWLAKRFTDIRVTFLDNDAMALSASRETCRINGIEPVAIVAGNGLKNVRGRFNAIVSNPPFHQGVKTQYETTEQFLRGSRTLLKPKGRLRIVANNFLRYPPIIEAVFGHCQILAKRDGFSVYEAFNR